MERRASGLWIPGSRKSAPRNDAAYDSNLKIAKLGLLGFLFAKSGIQLILCDSRRRVAALIKILFFGAITHHAGMGNIRLLTGILWNRRFIHHIKYSGAGAPLSTPACSIWFRASAKNRPSRHFAARSDPSKQYENDNDDQDDPENTDATVTVAVAVAAEAAAEATQQENDEKDDEDGSERHELISFGRP